ncbi:nitrous oxide reductase accessory protein NosL [uncultured Croceitalea sp.]|uniref:nitrous oxide reductase accessory protein NosL n=1 Tax=uncultured Croceitalea sp. TaxID=1798908 RepID=UPI00374FBC6B
MKPIKVISILLVYTIFIHLGYAQTSSCAYCKMDIKDASFKSRAITNSDKTLEFDAIECLVNYVEKKNERSFKKLEVTDYNTTVYIPAESAHYLKSKAIPSPMGANLSAFENRMEVMSTKKDLGGELFTWTELLKSFTSAEYGSVSHSHHEHHRPDAYAPSAIMGDHLHPKGGLMVSLRTMYMTMNGNLQGDTDISNESIYENFMVAPQTMSMQMHMLGAMYAPTDKLTLTLMQNYITKDMDLTARMIIDNGMPMLRDFSTSSSGIGDLKVGTLYGLIAKEKLNLHVNAIISVPIGGIENRDATPMMANAKLPYAMQLGSGTFDFTLGGTLKGNIGQISWGLQQLSTIRTGTNSENYRFGNLFQLHSWAAYSFSNVISTSFRLSASSEAEINGEDSDLNRMMVTTANPSNYGGELLRGALGINILLPKSNLVFSAEVGTPLYQNYNGIFMNESLGVNASLRYTVL